VDNSNRISKEHARSLPDEKMISYNPSGWVGKSLFRLVLFTLGMGMELACRLSETFRRQVTRDLTIQIGSADGVFHQYAFASRAVTSRSRSPVAPTLALCFSSANQGFITLLSPHAVGRIVHALLEGSVEYQGNAVLLLWFYGLTRFVLPIGRTGPLPVALPDAYVAPSKGSSVAGRIMREPSVIELDPTWQLAHRRRAKMAMLRVAAGESIPMW
jgi:hypothetical protein